MPLSFVRVVCGTCEGVISDGWPPDAPLEQCVVSRQICRTCEEEAALAVAEDRRRGVKA